MNELSLITPGRIAKLVGMEYRQVLYWMRRKGRKLPATKLDGLWISNKSDVITFLSAERSALKKQAESMQAQIDKMESALSVLYSECPAD